MKEHLKRNKLLFALPLLLLPFVVLIFYVLDGGTEVVDKEEQQVKNQETSGANYIIPEADKSIEIYDKMEAYQKDENNEREQQLIQKDTVENLVIGTEETQENATLTENLPLLAENKEPGDLLAHIRNKEKQLKKELSGEEEVQQKTSATISTNQRKPSKPVVRQKAKQEERPITTTGIRELDQIVDQNLTLSRQNDSLKSSLQQTRYRLDLLEKSRDPTYTLEKRPASGFGKEEKKDNSLIKAEIYETATVLDGNRVKLRLLEDTRINGQKIARHTFIYGICKIKNERLLISITQMPIQENFVPVKLSICDLDGLEGLYVPDNAARKVYQEVGASTNTSSLLGVTNDPLTYAGIRAADRAAQTMLKRVRLKKVTIKKNTLVYLINQK